MAERAAAPKKGVAKRAAAPKKTGPFQRERAKTGNAKAKKRYSIHQGCAKQVLLAVEQDIGREISEHFCCHAEKS